MSNFVDVLNDMRAHYKNNISNGLAIPFYPDLVEDGLTLEEASTKFFVTSDENDSEKVLLHKDLKCKAPLIEPNLRRNLGKWST
ncbi:hypothetical protein [Acinetobacter haemolyticus]|uniref:hypothetical protein n=1 Tax=Acinetobacter haemolyticus TaxID=29430 RepID=UPI001419D0EA|nr:hypothetical protein [Acinetobacter haemolyticus]